MKTLTAKQQYYSSKNINMYVKKKNVSFYFVLFYFITWMTCLAWIQTLCVWNLLKWTLSLDLWCRQVFTVADRPHWAPSRKESWPWSMMLPLFLLRWVFNLLVLHYEEKHTESVHNLHVSWTLLIVIVLMRAWAKLTHQTEWFILCSDTYFICVYKMSLSAVTGCVKCLSFFYGMMK